MSDPAPLLSSAAETRLSEVEMSMMPEVSAMYTGICLLPLPYVTVNVLVPPSSLASVTSAPDFSHRPARLRGVKEAPLFITTSGVTRP